MTTHEHIHQSHGTTKPSTTLRSTTQPSTLQHRTAHPNTANHNTEDLGTARHTIAQHSPATRSTAQHSSAQHNTTQHTYPFRVEELCCCRLLIAVSCTSARPSVQSLTVLTSDRPRADCTLCPNWKTGVTYIVCVATKSRSITYCMN